MSVIEVQNITKTLTELCLHPEYFEHAPVITSEDAAKTRGLELKQGIKALLFTNGKKSWVIVDVPANKKADLKKIATALEWSKRETRMATPEEVLEVTGCEIGSVPPFGHKQKVIILVDIGVYDNISSAYNIGLRTHSVVIDTHEMRAVFNYVEAIEGDFAKI